MSYAERPVFPKPPQYFALDSTGFVNIGGTFNGGTMSWLEISYPRDPNECIIYVVIVQNAQWTNSGSYSSNLLLTGSNKKFVCVVNPFQSVLGMALKSYWNADGTLNYLRLESTVNSDNSPISANFFVWADADASFQEGLRGNNIHEFEKLNKVVKIFGEDKNIKTEDCSKGTSRPLVDEDFQLLPKTEKNLKNTENIKKK
jgi:hypothetical protein